MLSTEMTKTSKSTLSPKFLNPNIYKRDSWKHFNLKRTVSNNEDGIDGILKCLYKSLK